LPERFEDAVVVCGAGAAGLSASLSSAAHGAQVLLLEAQPELGGTVADALIHTLAGFYDSAGNLLHQGLPRELIERLSAADPLCRRRKMGRVFVQSVCPNSYRRVVTQWIGHSPRIAVCCGTRAVGVRRAQGRIVELTAHGPAGTFTLRLRAVIDATGTAEIVRLIDPALVIDDERRAAGGWIFRLRGIEPGSLEFPRGLAVVRHLRQAAAAGRLPPDCAKTWVDVGHYEDEAFVKLFVPLAGRWREREARGEVSAAARAAQDAVVAELRQLPGMSRAEVTQSGSLGVRDGGRIRGLYSLSVEDVRAGRRFADAVACCAWPIEYWDPQQGVSIEYLPDGTTYDIPMRSLRLSGLENFWAAGKCLSADRRAHASARVVGACWAMGQSVGQAAAEARPVCWSEMEAEAPARQAARKTRATSGAR
jgi:hypothetical protein